MTKNKKIVSAILAIAIIVIGGIALWKLRVPEPENLPQQNLTTVPSREDPYTKGVIVVGFNKGITQAQAEAVLQGMGLTFDRTRNVNMGMKFFAETGETFLVKVPEGEESAWMEKFSKIPGVKGTGSYLDPNKIQVD